MSFGLIVCKPLENWITEYTVHWGNVGKLLTFFGFVKISTELHNPNQVHLTCLRFYADF